MFTLPVATGKILERDCLLQGGRQRVKVQGVKQHYDYPVTLLTGSAVACKPGYTCTE